MLGSLIQLRFSHVGRRAVLLNPEISYSWIDIKNPKPPTHRTTTISKELVIEGQKGALSLPFADGLLLSSSEIEAEEGKMHKKLSISLDEKLWPLFTRRQQKFVKSMWGLSSALLSNYAIGVSEGVQVSLKLVGVGYKASLNSSGDILSLKVGYCHSIDLKIPFNLTVAVPNPTKIIVKGINWQKVKEFAAKIRSHRPPEPYNGKGIFVDDETIKLKEGKKK